MAKYLTPDVAYLLDEFLEEAVDQRENDEIRARWALRDDLAEAMRPFLELAERTSAEQGVGVLQATWGEEAAALFPDALFWQFALFRTCARRSVNRLAEVVKRDVQIEMESLPGFGVF